MSCFLQFIDGCFLAVSRCVENGEKRSILIGNPHLAIRDLVVVDHLVCLSIDIPFCHIADEGDV